MGAEPAAFEISTESCARAYAGKRALITGAGGFIGGSLLSALSGVACEITAVSRKPLDLKSGAARIFWQRPDYGRADFWAEVLSGVDVVFHFAAQTSAAAAAADTVGGARVNVWPLLALVQACLSTGSRPAVLLAGTATQTGIPAAMPVDESAPSCPMTVYDLHKQMAEDYLKFFCRQGVLRGASLRLPNVYGPGNHPSSSERGVLNQVIRAALRGEKLFVHGSGEAARDYLYIEDAVEAFLAAGLSIDALNGGHFMIGTGKGTSLREAFKLVSERVGQLTGQTVKVGNKCSVPAAPLEERRFEADPRLFSALTGWRSRVSLSEGIGRCVSAWRAA